MKKSKQILFAILWVAPGMLRAQTLAIDVIAATGETFTVASGEAIVWTLGEVAVEHYQQQSALSEGFHQGYGVATPIFEAPNATMQILVYPNPAVAYIMVESRAQVPVEASLFDLYGRMLVHQKLIQTQEKIDLRDLPAGVYCLSIYDEQGLLNSFRIQKVNR